MATTFDRIIALLEDIMEGLEPKVTPEDIFMSIKTDKSAKKLSLKNKRKDELWDLYKELNTDRVELVKERTTIRSLKKKLENIYSYDYGDTYKKENTIKRTNVERTHYSAKNPTIEEFKNAIRLRMNDPLYSSLTLAYYEGVDQKVRMLPLTIPKGTDIDLLFDSLLEDGNELYLTGNLYERTGSDVEEYDDKEINISDFWINRILVTAGHYPQVDYNSKKAKNIMVGNYHCVNLGSQTNNNCLLECLRFLSKKMNKTSFWIKKNLLGLGKKDTIELTRLNLMLLKKYFGKDYVIIDRKANVLFGTFVIRPDFVLMFDNGHISYIKKEVKNKKTIKIFKKNTKNSKYKRKPEFLYYFDYETIFNINGFLEPYSVAAIKCTMEGKLLDTFYYQGENVNRNFFNFLYKTPGRHNILIGFNNSRFDNFLLLPELLANEVVGANSIFMAGNSILGMKFCKYETFDVCRYVNTSLANACRAFKCQDVKDFLDHSEIQDLYFSDTINFHKNLLETYGDKIEKYNIMDCVCLNDLYFKVKEAFSELGYEQNILESKTISAFSYKAFKKDKTLYTPETHNEWLFYRKSCYGGRSEVFKKGIYKGANQSYDVCSLYPYVMLFYYPVGEPKYTRSYVKGKMGIYRVKINKQPKCNIIPLRTKDKPLNWKSEEAFETNLTTVDIENLLTFDSDIEIFEGYYWEKKEKLFDSFVRPLKEAKGYQDSIKGSPEYNGALREMTKLAMNSLSGKMIQRFFLSNTQILTKKKDMINFMDQHDKVTFSLFETYAGVIFSGDTKNFEYKQKKAYPCYLGSFIYSYSRTHMYQSVISKTPKRRAMDTDSLHANPIDFPKEDEVFNPSDPFALYCKFNIAKNGEKNFGQFEGEIEFDVETSYYIAPKCYGIFGKDKCKMRFKGIGRRDKLVTDIPNFNSLNLMEQKKVYDNAEPALCEELYKKLANEEPVYILCSQLKKIINDIEHGFKLKQVYMIKRLQVLGFK